MCPSSPYARFKNDDLILRDELALDRTILANERTVLAYARTALGGFITGASMLKFFPESMPMMIFGIAFIAAAVLILAMGSWKYFRLNSQLSQLRQKP